MLDSQPRNPDKLCQRLGFVGGGHAERDAGSPSELGDVHGSTPSAVGREVAGVEAGDRHADAGAVERAAEARLGVAEAVRRLALLVDVLAHEVDELRLAVDDEAEQEPAAPLARRPEPDLDRRGVARARDELGPAGPERRAVLGVQQLVRVRAGAVADGRAADAREGRIRAHEAPVEADRGRDVGGQLEEALAERARRRGTGDACGGRHASVIGAGRASLN